MSARSGWWIAVMAFGCLLSAGGADEPKSTKERIMSMQLSSTAFSNGQSIPKKHTGQGDDISPPLSWSGAPAGTKSFALIVEDPDAPLMTFTHWVIFNLPADQASLPENVARSETLPNGAKQGKNSFQKTGYGGPMPPTKKPHRYYFKLYALDTVLDLEAHESKKELERAMEGHVLGEGELMGTYGRQ